MPTSEPQRCYVYIQLPESLDVVTCGQFELDREVGRFVYGKSYLASPRAVPLDPFELPLRDGTFESARNGGMFGALRDSSPDSWGRRVIERELGRVDLSEVDYLLHSPEDRAGALSFGTRVEPPAPVHDFNKILQLEALVAEAQRIEDGLPPSSRQVASLANAGSSLGGARPKNVVEDRSGLWVAKFPSKNDRWNYVAAEAAMLELARECGLTSAEWKLSSVGDTPVLLVRRFDRASPKRGYVRHRMVSALTALRADEADRARWSYVLLADELMRWVADPTRDLAELFGRMVFNALISNIDDHPRNHALIAETRKWRLSPAYDLTPFPQASQERDLAMIAGRSRRATRQNLLSECARFRISREDADARITSMKKLIAVRWRPLLRDCGGTPTDAKALERAFNFDGFEYEG
ncbi:MAG: type II toxin-antitoxin system HipA family toxin [Myxococcaceae bacterium]